MSTEAKKAYSNLCERFDEIALLNSAAGHLGWDQETYLPKGGGPVRSRQLSYLSGKVHQLATSDDVGGWISECEGGDFTDGSIEAANISGWRHGYDRAVKLPSSLVKEFAGTTSEAVAVWQDAREKSDFSLFSPTLAKVVDLTRQKAEAWGYESEPYDALLEEYERGVCANDIATVFDALEPELVEIVAEACSAKPGAVLPSGPYPVADQMEFNAKVAAAIGFDFDRGRIDTAAHPFCTGLTPGDTRLTTRYTEDDFTSSLFGVLHEAGHGMYEQGLLADQWGRPAGTSVSLGIHESQSRLWENHVGRSAEFWEVWLPEAQKSFPVLEGLAVGDMVKIVNTAKKSHIRVEADEVTYDLHILLRFQLERALFAGDLDVADLAGEWNTRFEELFGLPVKKDADGCLQDIHWSFGLIGYFPTYTLGNLNAAQLYRAAHQQLPSLAGELASGRYGSLLSWLNTNVHEVGMQKTPPEILSDSTGEAVQSRYHLEHLRSRYLG